jgi:cell division protein FtsB
MTSHSSLTSYLPYLRVAKAESIAVLRVNEIFQIELCQGALEQAELNGLELKFSRNMNFSYTFFSAVSTEKDKQAWRVALDDIIAINPDALFICDYGQATEFAVAYMKTKNWLPKSLTITTRISAWTDPSNLNYITSTTSYDRQARFPKQTNFENSAGYDTLVRSRYNVAPTAVAARSTLAGMIFSNALKVAASNSSQDILTALSTAQFSSFMGTSVFDAGRRQTLAALVVQLTNNGSSSNVVGPALAAVEQLIYPIPTWEERIFAPKWGHGVEIAGAVLMAIGGAVNVAWIIFLIIHWNHRVIVAASPLFLLAMLLGSLIVFVSIFSWMPNLINDSICNLRAWLLPLGFMTMFGALLSKTHRIHRLYNSKGISIIVIRNVQVALITLAIVVGQAILSILMITVTKLNSKIHIVDVDRISHNYYVCTFSTALKILFGLNVGYAFVLLIWGSYLAYRIRKVPISIYDESKVIAFSIYNTAFFGVIVIVVQLAIGNGNRYVTFMITAVCCFLGAMVTTGCLFGAKLWAIYKPSRDGKSSGTTMGTSSSGDSRSKPGSIQGSIAREPQDSGVAKKYKKKYKSLKNQNKDLKERIRQLESLAKSNGFLHENDTEMQANNTPATPAKVDPKTPKPPMNADDLSDTDEE